MSPGFDIRTAYWLLGVLSLVCALGVHASLRMRGRRRHQTWAWGGACFGGALVMIASRGWVPDFVTYELSHLLFAGAFLLQASALGAELGRGWTPVPMLATAAGSGATYAVLTSLDRGWGLMFNTLTLLVGSAVLLAYAWRLWRHTRQLPCLVIGAGYSLLLLTLLARILSLLQSTLGRGGPFEPGSVQVVLMLGGLFAIILGHLGYLGLQFLRIAAEQIEGEREAAREAERSRQVRERAAALQALLEERNQLIQRIARSEAANDLAQFATTLPHELSQPLSAAKLNLDSLRSALEPVADPALLALVRAIETSNERVLDLLQQLRILLQGPEVSGGEVLDLQALVMRTLPVLEGSFREHGVRLVPAMAIGRAEVRASATQLQQLLLILCGRALDDLRRQRPSGREPQVRVSVSGDGREVCLRVEDSGIASTPLRSRLMAGGMDGLAEEGFAAGDRLGAGIAVARRVAQAHHGQLTLEDSALGGIAFVLTLPSAAVMAAAGQVVDAWPQAAG